MTVIVYLRALHYLLEQWPYLIRYLEDVQLELSNNRAERSIKPFVMGRKNWLFANTPGGAQSSSVICSLIETAKENGLDPYRYLLWVLRNAPAMSQTDEGLGRTTRACQCTPGMQNVKRMNISGLSYVSYARDAFLYAGRFDGYVTYVSVKPPHVLPMDRLREIIFQTANISLRLQGRHFV